MCRDCTTRPNSPGTKIVSGRKEDPRPWKRESGRVFVVVPLTEKRKDVVVGERRKGGGG